VATKTTRATHEKYLSKYLRRVECEITLVAPKHDAALLDESIFSGICFDRLQHPWIAISPPLNCRPSIQRFERGGFECFLLLNQIHKWRSFQKCCTHVHWRTTTEPFWNCHPTCFLTIWSMYFRGRVQIFRSTNVRHSCVGHSRTMHVSVICHVCVMCMLCHVYVCINM
jgi:hypothetical protein